MATPVRTDKNNGPTDRSTEPRTWDPLAEARTVLSQLSRFPDSWSDLLAPVRDSFIPLADVEETDDAYVIEVELPGIDRRDVDISIAGRRLTITGERKEKERVGIVRRRTRSVGRFEYDIQLPGDVDEEDSTASMADGVLTIRIPKATTERARRIAVK